MKRLLCISLCVLFFSFGVGENTFAQTNLVPNSSFETYTNCPNNGSQINYVPPWYSPTQGSPDYFNECAGSSTSTMGVPLNGLGYQYPRTGTAYSGIYCYDASPGSTIEIKEYLQVALTDSLITNRKYCVSFYINLAKPLYRTFTVTAITKIGIYISDTAVSDTTQLTLPFAAQIQSPAGYYLSDTVNWM